MCFLEKKSTFLRTDFPRENGMFQKSDLLYQGRFVDELTTEDKKIAGSTSQEGGSRNTEPQKAARTNTLGAGCGFNFEVLETLKWA